jgi:hypothetical protein
VREPRAKSFHNPLEGIILTSSSIIGPPSIRRIKPKPLMSFYYRLPSLQRAILGAVKWAITAAHSGGEAHHHD